MEESCLCSSEQCSQVGVVDAISAQFLYVVHLAHSQPFLRK